MPGSLLFMIYLTSMTIIGYCPQPSSALVYSPWRIVDEDDCSCHSHNNIIISRSKSAISSFLAQLKRVPQCGDGLWYRVAYLDMRNSTQECPSNWMERSTPQLRACGRPTSVGANCSSENFSTGALGLQYSKVCGRVIGYQYGNPGAFNLHRRPQTNSPDDNYVDGVSVTHGLPRSHIWTYAAGVSGAISFDHSGNCPCTNPAASTNVLPPHFVGDNYFCESGNQENRIDISKFFDADPLWDGEQCEGECCSNGKSPPWFSVTLPKLTSDDIEVRICGDEDTHNEDTPIQLLEIYMQ